MIVAEAPGKEENEALEPLVGKTGQMTREMFEKAGMPWNETYRTNVVKFQPPFNDFTKIGLIGVDLQESTNKLWEEEIKVFNPNVILALGDRALTAVCGIDGILKYRGSILRAKDGMRKVVPTIHPAALFPKKDSEKGALPWVYKTLIQHDIQRAIDESTTPAFNLPDRLLAIAHSSLDVLRFFREYEALGKPAVDIESINCIPVSIAFAFTKHHSLTIPLLTRIGEHPLTDMSARELVTCWQFIQELLLKELVVGQNFKYDQFKMQLMRFVFKGIYSDTLLKTKVIWPELPDKDLGTQGSIWTREPFYKEEGKEPKIGKKFNVEQYFRYNGKDACVTKEVDDAQEQDLIDLGEQYGTPLRDLYYGLVVPKHNFYLKMENVGFRVDKEQKNNLLLKYRKMHDEAHQKLVEMVGHEVNTKSYPQVWSLLYEEMGFFKYQRDPTSEETIVKLLGNHCKGKQGPRNREILEGLLKDRRIRDQISRQINFVADYDDRCKSSFNPHGTETCRSTTTNLKKPVRPKKIGLPFHTISKHGDLAKDIRTMFIADEGMVFVSLDASQAEPRCVAVLSEDWKLLNAIQSGVVDIHRRTAALIFGYTSGLVLEGECMMADRMEKDGPERYTGKTTRNAGNYDVGKNTFMTTFNTNAQKYGINIEISEWRGGEMLRIFHEASPLVKSKFHHDIKEALMSTRCLVDPFGFPRIFYAKYDEDLWKEGYANIPQRTVSHLVQGAAIKADEEFAGDAKVYFCSENHDALVLQAPANDWERYARTVKKYMERPINFRTYCTLRRDIDLVIPCDIEVSETHYGALKKVKISDEVKERIA